MERVFPLKEYATLRLIDEIDELPDELALNPELVAEIRAMQLLQIELAHKRYLALHRNMAKFTSLDLDELAAELEKLRDESLKHITKLIKNGKIEE